MRDLRSLLDSLVNSSNKAKLLVDLARALEIVAHSKRQVRSLATWLASRIISVGAGHRSLVMLSLVSSRQ